MVRYRQIFFFLSLFFLFTSCKLIDQRTFNPRAGRRPIPYIPPAPPPPLPPAPPIEVVIGTPEGQWRKPLQMLTKKALEKKPDALFVVTAVTSDLQSLAAQEENLQKAVRKEAKLIADEIVKAGARPEQIQMDAKTSGSIKQTVVQVNVR